MVFLESFKGFVKYFRCGSLRGVLKAFQGCFRSVLGVCQRSYWSVWKFWRCFKEFSRCFRKVSWVPQGDFKGVSRVFHRWLKPFQPVSRGDSEGVSRVFYQSFKDLSKKCQRSFIEVSRKFQENVKVFNRSLKPLWGCFKVVLFLKVFCCMSLIAATRAEGGLVFVLFGSI